MSSWYMNYDVICHWCGKLFKCKKNRLQARFCCKACKQAHYRAYKNYVTAAARQKRFLELQAVTPKKGKKSCQHSVRKPQKRQPKNTRKQSSKKPRK